MSEPANSKACLAFFQARNDKALGVPVRSKVLSKEELRKRIEREVFRRIKYDDEI